MVVSALPKSRLRCDRAFSPGHSVAFDRPHRPGHAEVPPASSPVLELTPEPLFATMPAPRLTLELRFATIPALRLSRASLATRSRSIVLSVALFRTRSRVKQSSLHNHSDVGTEPPQPVRSRAPLAFAPSSPPSCPRRCHSNSSPALRLKSPLTSANEYYVYGGGCAWRKRWVRIAECNFSG